MRSNNDEKDAFVILNPTKVEKTSSGEVEQAWREKRRRSNRIVIFIFFFQFVLFYVL